MRTVIDAVGRLVVPEAARDQLGLAAGTQLELRVVDSRIEIEIPATPMRLARDEHGPVAFAGRLVRQDPDDLPAAVRLNRIRAERAVQAPRKRASRTVRS